MRTAKGKGRVKFTYVVDPSGGFMTVCYSLTSRFHSPTTGNPMSQGAPVARHPVGRRGILLWLVVALAMGCATYGERVAPVPLPATQAQHVDVEGVKLFARPYLDPEEAKAAFGFDIRGAGLLPVRFVIDNQSDGAARVRPDQTLLVDEQGNGWPLLTSEQAYQRVKGHVDVGESMVGAAKPAALLGVAGAVAGFAIGVVTGENVGDTMAKGAAVGAAAGAIAGGGQTYDSLETRVKGDLRRQSLRNRNVTRGELAHGYLFFPGKDEAGSVQTLRLGVEIGGKFHLVNLEL